MQQTVLAEVHGYVQGVGFRYFVYRAAIRNRLSGWVRNTARGSVEALLCGEEDALTAMRAEIERGPRFSHVKRVDWQLLSDNDLRARGEEIPITGAFEVRP